MSTSTSSSAHPSSQFFKYCFVMSETQGVKSSVANAIMLMTEAENNPVPTDHDNQSLTTIITEFKNVITTDDNDCAVQNNAVSSEEMRDTSNVGKSLNIKTNETTNYENVTAKRNQMIEKSVSGECRNIFPVLVERLRSALELSVTNSNSSVENTSYANSGLTTKPSSYTCSQYINDDTMKSQQPFLHTMDLNFFEDLLLTDIKTALARLQHMLCRVDVNALNRYSSSLQPNDKLHLLQLISNLVTNLKMVKLDDVSHPEPSINKMNQQDIRKRNRHTIGVSSEELACARKWLEERGTFISAPITASSARASVIVEPHSMIIPQHENSISPTIDNSRDQNFDNPRACDKQMKDALNQQQSLQNRSKDIEADNSIIINHDSVKNIACISNSDKYNETVDKINSSITPTAFITKSCNKFSAKKSKIKRANTIDIPNYVKLQVENNKQSASPGLRRPIDISDRLSWNPPEIINMVIPSFEPKTKNDRKFLALINRNNEINNNGTPSSNSPFKSFNYKQTNSIADENWKNRFSNIKTTFDKSTLSASSINGESFRRKSYSDNNKSINKSCSKERDKKSVQSIIPSVKLCQPTPIRLQEQDNNLLKKCPIFTHAVSSPFQKIQTSRKNIMDQAKPISSASYLPACTSSRMLRAKLKIFDNQDHIDGPSRKIMPKYPGVNFSHNAAEVIHTAPNKRNFLQTNIKTEQNNSDELWLGNNSRHNTIYHDHVSNIKKREIDVQHQQSVAVQTINNSIKKNNQIVDMSHGKSLTMHQQNDLPSNQEIYQISPSSTLQLPEISEIYCSENENQMHVSSETKPAHPMTMIVNKLLPPIMTNNATNQPYNIDVNSIHHNHNNSNDIENGTSISVDHSFMEDENIENQDISDNGIVTRYTSAIVTLEKSPSPPQTFSSITSTNDAQDNSDVSSKPVCRNNCVERHNMLQQNLIHRLQRQDDELQWTNRIIKPNQRYSTIGFEQGSNLVSYEMCNPLIESNNTQEKISLFEGKLIKKKDQTEKPESLTIPKVWHIIPDKAVAKNNIVGLSPTSQSQLHDFSLKINSEPSVPFKYQTGPGDSSDEYLVSCASQPHRSIVLSKSESWHQLAISKNHLQIPQQMSQQSQCKLPTQINLPLNKHMNYTSADKLKKIEEKVLRYFNNSCSVPTTGQKREYIKQTPRRSFSPKKAQALTKSHTMPHISDELMDIDKQFESLFEETTNDNQY